MALATEKQKKILDILENLPHEKVDELMDFARYLEKEKKPLQKPKKKTPPVNIPTFHLGRMMKHALERDHLYKEYLDRKFNF